MRPQISQNDEHPVVVGRHDACPIGSKVYIPARAQRKKRMDCPSFITPWALLQCSGSVAIPTASRTSSFQRPMSKGESPSAGIMRNFSIPTFFASSRASMLISCSVRCVR